MVSAMRKNKTEKGDENAVTGRGGYSLKRGQRGVLEGLAAQGISQPDVEMSPFKGYGDI